jgi:hypothetical protein
MASLKANEIHKYNIMVWASAFIFLIGLWAGKDLDCVGVFLAEIGSKLCRIFIAVWYLGRDSLRIDVKRVLWEFLPSWIVIGSFVAGYLGNMKIAASFDR